MRGAVPQGRQKAGGRAQGAQAFKGLGGSSPTQGIKALGGRMQLLAKSKALHGHEQGSWCEELLLQLLSYLAEEPMRQTGS